MCDVAYALLTEQARQVSLALISAGAEPSLLWEALDSLDADLTGQVTTSGKTISREQADLHRALGVA